MKRKKTISDIHKDKPVSIYKLFKKSDQGKDAGKHQFHLSKTMGYTLRIQEILLMHLIISLLKLLPK